MIEPSFSHDLIMIYELVGHSWPFIRPVLTIVNRAFTIITYRYHYPLHQVGLTQWPVCCSRWCLVYIPWMSCQFNLYSSDLVAGFQEAVAYLLSFMLVSWSIFPVNQVVGVWVDSFYYLSPACKDYLDSCISPTNTTLQQKQSEAYGVQPSPQKRADPEESTHSVNNLFSVHQAPQVLIQSMLRFINQWVTIASCFIRQWHFASRVAYGSVGETVVVPNRRPRCFETFKEIHELTLAGELWWVVVHNGWYLVMVHKNSWSNGLAT